MANTIQRSLKILKILNSKFRKILTVVVHRAATTLFDKPSECRNRYPRMCYHTEFKGSKLRKIMFINKRQAVEDIVCDFSISDDNIKECAVKGRNSCRDNDVDHRITGHLYSNAMGTRTRVVDIGAIDAETDGRNLSTRQCVAGRWSPETNDRNPYIGTLPNRPFNYPSENRSPLTPISPTSPFYPASCYFYPASESNKSNSMATQTLSNESNGRSSAETYLNTMGLETCHSDQDLDRRSINRRLTNTGTYHRSPIKGKTAAFSLYRETNGTNQNNRLSKPSLFEANGKNQNSGVSWPDLFQCRALHSETNGRNQRNALYEPSTTENNGRNQNSGVSESGLSQCRALHSDTNGRNQSNGLSERGLFETTDRNENSGVSESGRSQFGVLFSETSGSNQNSGVPVPSLSETNDVNQNSGSGKLGLSETNEKYQNSAVSEQGLSQFGAPFSGTNTRKQNNGLSEPILSDTNGRNQNSGVSEPSLSKFGALNSETSESNENNSFLEHLYCETNGKNQISGLSERSLSEINGANQNGGSCKLGLSETNETYQTSQISEQGLFQFEAPFSGTTVRYKNNGLSERDVAKTNDRNQNSGVSEPGLCQFGAEHSETSGSNQNNDFSESVYCETNGRNQNSGTQEPSLSETSGGNQNCGLGKPGLPKTNDRNQNCGIMEPDLSQYRALYSEINGRNKNDGVSEPDISQCRALHSEIDGRNINNGSSEPRPSETNDKNQNCGMMEPNLSQFGALHSKTNDKSKNIGFSEPGSSETNGWNQNYGILEPDSSEINGGNQNNGISESGSSKTNGGNQNDGAADPGPFQFGALHSETKGKNQNIGFSERCFKEIHGRNQNIGVADPGPSQCRALYSETNGRYINNGVSEPDRFETNNRTQTCGIMEPDLSQFGALHSKTNDRNQNSAVSEPGLLHFGAWYSQINGRNQNIGFPEHGHSKTSRSNENSGLSERGLSKLVTGGRGQVTNCQSTSHPHHKIQGASLINGYNNYDTYIGNPNSSVSPTTTVYRETNCRNIGESIVGRCSSDQQNNGEPDKTRPYLNTDGGGRITIVPPTSRYRPETDFTGPNTGECLPGHSHVETDGESQNTCGWQFDSFFSKTVKRIQQPEGSSIRRQNTVRFLNCPQLSQSDRCSLEPWEMPIGYTACENDMRGTQDDYAENAGVGRLNIVGLPTPDTDVDVRSPVKSAIRNPSIVESSTGRYFLKTDSQCCVNEMQDDFAETYGNRTPEGIFFQTGSCRCAGGTQNGNADSFENGRPKTGGHFFETGGSIKVMQDDNKGRSREPQFIYPCSDYLRETNGAKTPNGILSEGGHCNGSEPSNYILNTQNKVGQIVPAFEQTCEDKESPPKKTGHKFFHFLKKSKPNSSSRKTAQKSNDQRAFELPYQPQPSKSSNSALTANADCAKKSGKGATTIVELPTIAELPLGFQLPESAASTSGPNFNHGDTQNKEDKQGFAQSVGNQAPVYNLPNDPLKSKRSKLSQFLKKFKLKKVPAIRQHGQKAQMNNSHEKSDNLREPDFVQETGNGGLVVLPTDRPVPETDVWHYVNGWRTDNSDQSASDLAKTVDTALQFLVQTELQTSSDDTTKEPQQDVVRSGELKSICSKTDCKIMVRRRQEGHCVGIKASGEKANGFKKFLKKFRSAHGQSVHSGSMLHFQHEVITCSIRSSQNDDTDQRNRRGPQPDPGRQSDENGLGGNTSSVFGPESVETSKKSNQAAKDETLFEEILAMSKTEIRNEAGGEVSEKKSDITDNNQLRNPRKVLHKSRMSRKGNYLGNRPSRPAKKSEEDGVSPKRINQSPKQRNTSRTHSSRNERRRGISMDAGVSEDFKKTSRNGAYSSSSYESPATSKKSVGRILLLNAKGNYGDDDSDIYTRGTSLPAARKDIKRNAMHSTPGKKSQNKGQCKSLDSNLKAAEFKKAKALKKANLLSTSTISDSNLDITIVYYVAPKKSKKQERNDSPGHPKKRGLQYASKSRMSIPMGPQKSAPPKKDIKVYDSTFAKPEYALGQPRYRSSSKKKYSK